jgi:hypothetical protein
MIEKYYTTPKIRHGIFNWRDWIWLALASLFGAMFAFNAHAGSGALLLQGSGRPSPATGVNANIKMIVRRPVARVSITQQFTNRTKEKFERTVIDDAQHKPPPEGRSAGPSSPNQAASNDNRHPDEKGRPKREKKEEDATIFRPVSFLERLHREIDRSPGAKGRRGDPEDVQSDRRKREYFLRRHRRTCVSGRD